jgi:hypothetical protein
MHFVTKDRDKETECAASIQIMYYSKISRLPVEEGCGMLLLRYVTTSSS